MNKLESLKEVFRDLMIDLYEEPDPCLSDYRDQGQDLLEDWVRSETESTSSGVRFFNTSSGSFSQISVFFSSCEFVVKEHEEGYLWYVRFDGNDDTASFVFAPSGT